MKAKLLVLIVLIFVLVSTMSFALTPEETKDGLKLKYNYVYEVDSALTERELLILNNYLDFDGVSVDNQGTVCFKKHLGGDLPEGVVLCMEEDYLVRTASIENVYTFFSGGDYDSLGPVIAYDSLKISYNGKIKFPIEINVEEGKPPYFILEIAGNSKISILGEDDSSLLTLATNPSNGYQKFVIVPKIKDMFSEDVANKLFNKTEDLSAFKGKVGSEAQINTNDILGKDFSMDDALGIWNGDLGSALGTLSSLDTNTLSSKGFFLRQNSTVYEFGRPPLHSRFLYPKGKYGVGGFDYLNVYKEFAKGKYVSYVLPSYLIADDGLPYAIDYGYVDLVPDATILEMSFGYIYDDRVSEEKDVSYTVDYETNPAGTPLVDLFAVTQLIPGFPSHIFANDDASQGEKGTMSHLAEFYEDDNTFVDASEISYNSKQVGNRYYGVVV